MTATNNRRIGFGVDYWPSSQMNHHKYRKSPKKFTATRVLSRIWASFHHDLEILAPQTLPKVDFLDWHYLPKCPEPIKFSLVKEKGLQNLLLEFWEGIFFVIPSGPVPVAAFLWE